MTDVMITTPTGQMPAAARRLVLRRAHGLGAVVDGAVLPGSPVVGAMFGLGPLFLLAGWFSPRSVAHRGVGGFARSRLLRLGVPLAAFMLLIQPLADYVGSLGPDQVRTSFASALRTTEFSVMWFVAALLVFSLAYAALRWLRPAPQSRRPACSWLVSPARITFPPRASA